MHTTFNDAPDIEDVIVDKLAEAPSTCKPWKRKKGTFLTTGQRLFGK
jgi:hypothetical protein